MGCRGDKRSKHDTYLNKQESLYFAQLLLRRIVKII
jgi:hypothetical protein